MPASLTVLRPPAAVPAAFTASVYLAGPDPAPGTPSWRCQALDLLAAGSFDGLVYMPEPAEGAPPLAPDALAAWDADALRHADAVLFWLPDGAPQAPVVSELWGAWRRSGKVVLGAPRLMREQLPRWFDRSLRVPWAYTLPDTVQLLWPLVRPGALRQGGERAVPLHLWRSPAFQRWYRTLRSVGNQLDDVDLEWSYRLRAPAGRPPLLWALRPRVWIRRERRYKAGEIIVGRADVSATVLYRPAPDPMETLVVLVREFRSAGLNGTGYVWELPGGSAERAADREQDARQTALREVEQETGLVLDPRQLVPVAPGPRQVAATILCHRAHLFRAELTEAQLAQLRCAESEGRPHGANAGERCYVALRTLRQIVAGCELDWGQIGMILLALGAPVGAEPGRSGRP